MKGKITWTQSAGQDSVYIVESCQPGLTLARGPSIVGTAASGTLSLQNPGKFGKIPQGKADIAMHRVGAHRTVQYVIDPSTVRGPDEVFRGQPNESVT